MEPTPEFPLDDIGIFKFKERGWVLLSNAFDPTAFRAEAESELSRLREQQKEPTEGSDKGTQARYHLPSMSSKRFDVKVTAPKVYSAICQLVGGEARLGKRLDGFSNCIARIQVKTGIFSYAMDSTSSYDWHVDGWHERHKVTSGDVGLVCLWLLTDCPPGGGGTVFAAKDSVPRVSRLLFSVGEEGVPARALHAADALPREKHLLRGLLRGCYTFDRLVGSAGDVALCHPFLIHRGDCNSSSPNPRILAVSHCPIGQSLRIGVSPSAEIKDGLPISVDDDFLPRSVASDRINLSPVEQCIADSLMSNRSSFACCMM